MKFVIVIIAWICVWAIVEGVPVETKAYIALIGYAFGVIATNLNLFASKPYNKE